MATDRFTAGAVAVAAALSVTCLALLGVRLAQSGEPTFEFMAWNLLLAWIPLVLTAALPPVGGRWSRRAAWPLLVVWLLFLPNAPYLVTDLVHLPGRPAGSPVIDLVVFPAFAAAGLFIGGVSLHMANRALAARLGARTAGVLTAACIVLAGVGMYIGRVLQWNSWDVVTSPGALFAALAERMADPWSLAAALALSAVCAGCVAIAYALVRSLAGHAARRA